MTIPEMFDQRINSMIFSGNEAAVACLKDLRDEVVKAVTEKEASNVRKLAEVCWPPFKWDSSL